MLKFDRSVVVNLNPILYFLVFSSLGSLSRSYWSWLNHPLMANIWEKAISILAGNLNSVLSYLITTVLGLKSSTFPLWAIESSYSFENWSSIKYSRIRRGCQVAPPPRLCKTLVWGSINEMWNFCDDFLVIFLFFAYIFFTFWDISIITLCSMYWQPL